MRDHYRLKASKKEEIAQNLIDIIDKDAPPSYDTRIFISNWFSTDRSKKFKAYYDVWEIVLRNFLPKTKPILFRSIARKSKAEYIASFTNSVFCAEKFSKSFSKERSKKLTNGRTIGLDGDGIGYWIICDTKDCLPSLEINKGKYRNTFYPVSEVLKKAKKNGGWDFCERILREYSKEDEYVMKIDYSIMQLVKYIDHNIEP